MTREQAYETLVRLERTLDMARLFVEEEIAPADELIYDLADIGRISGRLLAYLYDTNDDNMIRRFAALDNAVLFRLPGAYPPVVQVSAAESCRIFCRVRELERKQQRGATASTKQTPGRFTGIFTPERVERVFAELTESGIISGDLSVFRWWYGFGVQPDEPKPLTWLKSASLLAYYINQTAGAIPGKWNITAAAFVLAENKPIGMRYLSRCIAEINASSRELPKGFEDIDFILRN